MGLHMTEEFVEQIDERALLIRPRIDDVEELKQHERRKGHRLRVAEVTAAIDEASGERRVQYEQRAGCHDDADEDDAAPHAPGEHAFA
jgi:hypothetical protein